MTYDMGLKVQKMTFFKLFISGCGFFPSFLKGSFRLSSSQSSYLLVLKILSNVIIALASHRPALVRRSVQVQRVYVIIRKKNILELHHCYFPLSAKFL